MVEPKRILLIRLSHLGDVVHALPLATDLANERTLPAWMRTSTAAFRTAVALFGLAGLVGWWNCDRALR